jgi:uncharacterized membrane protein
MTEWQTPEPIPVQGKGTALLGYVLLIASPFLFLTGIIGVVLAYVYRDEAPEWLKSHYTLQIRTFWISLLVGVVSVPLLMVMVGYLILLLWLIWFLVRCIKGLRLLNMGRPYPNPQSWGF